MIKVIVIMTINYDDLDDDRFVEEIVEAAGPRSLRIKPWWWTCDHSYHNDHVIKLIVMMIINYDDLDDDRFVEEIVEAAGPWALMAHGTQSTSARRQKLCKVNCFQ